MVDKKIGASIIISVAIIAGALFLAGGSSRQDAGVQAQQATIVDGKQIVDITARGGYSPRLVKAKAGVPTTIRVTTKDTYDCSVSLVIPKLSYKKFLGPTGTEEIAISPDQAKGTYNGLCSMGMYSFKVVFE